MSARRISLWLLTLAAGTGLGAAAISWSQPASSGLAVPPAATPEDLSLAFREVAGRVLPAVVWIETHATVHRETAEDGDEDTPNPSEDLFRRFFGDDPRFKGFQFPNLPDMQEMPREGHGSGFVVDSSGIILTNAHVVEGADRVIVHFQDGSEVKADEVVADARSDVAIVRVSTGKPLPVLSLGDSDAMQVGDWVLAAGNPFDVGVTVTAGIISATGRRPLINDRENYLQTDAAINPGNSGGPLVNLRGEVIGINTAISTSSGGYDGVGFAIPVNMVRWVADQLIEDGEVRRAVLGVALETLTNDLRRAFGVPLGQGALVVQVLPDLPAAEAGLQVGDIIMEIAGQQVKDSGDLQGIVEALEVDQQYPLKVLRDGESITLDVKLAAMPKDFSIAGRRQRPEGSDEPEKEEEPAPEFDDLGLQVQAIDETLREQLQLGKGSSGVVVTAVKEGSPGARAGLRSGDVIEKVVTTPVATPEDFHAAVEKLSLDQGVALLVTRGERSTYVVVKSE